jgi:hypothetical protein
MTKVMLIGDSIRLGYQDRVKDLLAGQAAVTGPADNCRFAAYTLFYVGQWVIDDDHDVIQWNNGQWDVCTMPDGRIHTPLATYIELQKRIADILIEKTKRLIFACTTPVWPEVFTSFKINPRRNEDIVQYNRAATDTLSKLGVEINDLYSPAAEDVKRYISEDMIHLSEEGIDLCAGRVAELVNGA